MRPDPGKGRHFYLAVFLGLLLVSSCAGFGKVSEKAGKGDDPEVARSKRLLEERKGDAEERKGDDG